jgi:hypothetical protein
VPDTINFCGVACRRRGLHRLGFYQSMTGIAYYPNVANDFFFLLLLLPPPLPI